MKHPQARTCGLSSSRVDWG